MEDSQEGPGNEGNEVWERQQRFTQTAGRTHAQTDRDTHRPSLDSKSLPRASEGPTPFTHLWVHTYTYSRSSFTTSTQRESVREVAEADLGWS